MSVPVLCKTEEIIVDTGDYNSDDAIEEDHLRITLEDTGGEYQTYHTTAEQQTVATTVTTNSSSPRTRNNNYSNAMSSSTTSSAVTHHLITPSGKSGTTKNLMENEKRMRREIANSNERRRMQSINAGFQSLRSLLPHHEGEKLSKAAILQQTAQYIFELEREKTHLLSQNSQLKRLLGQHEVGGDGGGGGGDGIETTTGTPKTITMTTATTANVAIKKRKFADNVVTVQTISDSSDEGLGSMSPEPVTLISNATGATKTVTNVGTATTTAVATAYLNVNTKELSELKSRLEAERSRRTLLEERLRQLERQIYPATNQYIHREVIEHTDNLREEDIPMSFTPLQVVEIDSLPTVGQTQVVVCHSLDDDTMTADEEEVISGDLISNVREEVVIGEELPREYVELPSRLQPILEAAIKAEPKVEVERINSTLTKIKTSENIKPTKDNNNSNTNNSNKQPSGRRMYIANTSRQNLETIVEAIRHLEGDHLFAENGNESKKSSSPTTVKSVVGQETPLALTTTNKQTATVMVSQQQQQQQQHQHQLPQQRKLPIELTPFLQPKKQTGNTITIVGSLANATTALAVGSSSSNSNSSNLATSSASSTNGNSCNVVTLKTQQQQQQQQHSSEVIATTAAASTRQIRITEITSLKQCRPGVIVAKQVS